MNDDQKQLQLQEQISQLEAIAKKLFTREALQRYGNIKAAHPEKAVQVLVVIGRAMQQGTVGKIDDAQLKELLKQLDAGKKDIHIKRL